MILRNEQGQIIKREDAVVTREQIVSKLTQAKGLIVEYETKLTTARDFEKTVEQDLADFDKCVQANVADASPEIPTPPQQ